MPFPTALDSDAYIQLRGDSTTPPTYWASEFVVFATNFVVMSARINGTTSGTSYAQVTYDGATGDYTQIQANSLVLISLTNDPRAAFFVGRARLNGAGVVATSSILYVNESSQPIPDNAYLWAIRDFRLSDRLSRQVGLTQYSDFDISVRPASPYITGVQSAYADVVDKTTDEYEIAFTPTGRPIASGATINNATWHWYVPTDTGSVTYTVGSSTSQNPTISFEAGYSDWVTCYVSDSNGNIGFFHFYVAAVPQDFSSVISPYVANVNLTLSENGWDGTLDAYAGVNELIDNTLCIVFDKEVYNGIPGSLQSNVRFVGRIRKESNQTTGDETYNQLQQATYELEGLIAQFSRVEHLPFTMRNASVPTVFDEMLNLTIWRGIAYTLYWRSTFLELFALSFDSTDNTFLYPLLPTQGGNIFAIIKELADNINAILQTAPTGEAQIVREANFLSTAQRNALTTVANFETVKDAIDFNLDNVQVDTSGKVQAYGGYYNPSSGNVIALASIAPGLAQGIGESINTFSRNVLAATSSQVAAQAELDSRSGNQYEIVRRAQPQLVVTFPDGYDFITASANQWYTWTIAASEDTGGRAFTTADRWLCVAGTQTHDFGVGTKAVQYTFQLESEGTPGTKPPDVPPQGVQPTLPIIPPLPAFPSLPPPPSIYMPPVLLPGDNPPYVSPVVISNGNLIGLISSSQEFTTPNALLTSTPTFNEGTPDDTLTYTAFQWVGLGSKGAYLLGNDGTDSTFYYSEDATQANPTWVATPLTGLYAVIRVGSTAGVVWCEGRENNLTPADDWDIGSGDFSGGTITNRTGTTITASSTLVGGSRYQVGILSSDVNTCAKVTYEILSGGYTDFVDWVDCGYPQTIAGGGFHFGYVNGECANSILAFTDVSGTFSIRYTFVATDDCGDAFVSAYQSIYSEDYGATFASPEVIDVNGGGFDTVKVGDVALAGGVGQVYKASAGGAWAAYGDPLPDAASVPTCIWIPYINFSSTSTKNSSTSPQYLVGLSSLTAGNESLYRVTAAGTVFTDITPLRSGVYGVPVGENSLAMSMRNGNKIAGIFSFSGTRRLYTSTNAGTSWVDRGVVGTGAQSVRFRRGDRNATQLCIGNGSTGLTVSQNFGSTILAKTNPSENAITFADFF